MKQTAVEWLKEQYDSCPPYEPFLGESEWEQAKEMEKQQTIDFAMKFMMQDRPIVSFYNETFKSE